MNDSLPGSPRFAWALAVLAIVPYAGLSILIWTAQTGPLAHLAPWGLCLYAAGLIGATGLWRLKVGLDQGLSTDTRTLALATVTPSLAILACAAAPWIGFRWALALLIAALSMQGLLDVAGDSMPGFFRQIRTAVSVAGLLSLLVGLLGA